MIGRRPVGHPDHRLGYHLGGRRRRPTMVHPVVAGAIVGVLLAPVAWTSAQALRLPDAPPATQQPADRDRRPSGPSGRAGQATGRAEWSALALADIPPGYRSLYRRAADTCPRLTPQLLAGIGWRESDHGRLDRPGVRAGLNRYQDRTGRWRRCCAGPMQFNLVNGPPSTWQAYARPGDNPYDPADAIPAAARKLCHDGLGPGAYAASWAGRRGIDPCPGQAGPAHVDRALRRYNNACAYAAQVVARARAYTPTRTGAGGEG